MYILHTSTELHHVFSKHVLFHIFYPSVILLCTDDIFVSLHISSTVYLRLWIIYNVPRTQNILLCFYPNKHLYVLHINRLWLQFVRWITVLSVTKKVLQHDKTLYCSCCCKYIHRNCSGLLNAQYEYVKSDTSWYCKKYIGEMFPFNHIDDESIFLKAISEISPSSDIIIRHHTESKIFNPFEINEDDSNILEYQGDLDPDKCFFNQHSHSLLEACNYQTEQTFNNYVSRKGISNNNFSLFHLNVRSVPANHSSLLSYMENIEHRFSVIGLTETWLRPSNIDAYGHGWLQSCWYYKE